MIGYERTVVAEFVDLTGDGLVIVLIDEEGQEYRFLLLIGFGIEENNYIVAFPLEQFTEEGEEEVVILKIISDESGNELFADINDDDEWNVAVQAWQEYVNQSEYN